MTRTFLTFAEMQATDTVTLAWGAAEVVGAETTAVAAVVGSAEVPPLQATKAAPIALPARPMTIALVVPRNLKVPVCAT